MRIHNIISCCFIWGLITQNSYGSISTSLLPSPSSAITSIQLSNSISVTTQLAQSFNQSYQSTQILSIQSSSTNQSVSSSIQSVSSSIQSSTSAPSSSVRKKTTVGFKVSHIMAFACGIVANLLTIVCIYFLCQPQKIPMSKSN